MNWEDRIENIKFSIETGDGKVFFPLYSGGEKEREYNTSSFEFIEVYGTLVQRKKPKSAKFPLIFYFEGADNIDKSQEFEDSADDPRPWTVTHPYYGTISGQPISLKRMDSSMNVTEITVVFWESIDADYPTYNFSVKDNTRDKHREVYSACALAYVTNVDFAAIDVSKSLDSLKEIKGAMEVIQNGNTYSAFQNAFNSGLSAIDDLLDGPLNAIQTAQNFLDLPATYELALIGRVASYQNAFNRLKSTIKTLADKKYFEAMGGSIIASVSLAMVNPFRNDYDLVSDVEKMSSLLSKMHSDYVSLLGDSVVSIYDVKNSFAPDGDVQNKINSLVTSTISNLYKISFSSKRERIIRVNKDTNLILFVHQYLGSENFDENLEKIKATNNIGFKELLLLKKGRELKYAK